MLTAEERNTIINALAGWAERTGDEATIGFLQNKELMTPRQVVAEVRNETQEGNAVLTFLEHSVRREGLEEVVRRFRG